MFNVSYNFQPGDSVFVVYGDDNSVSHGIVCQFEYDVYPDVDNGNIERKLYLVLLDGDEGTTELSSDAVFNNIDDAILYATS